MMHALNNETVPINIKSCKRNIKCVRITLQAGTTLQENQEYKIVLPAGASFHPYSDPLQHDLQIKGKSI